MSLYENAIRTLARALGMELVRSTTKNPFASTYGKYCLWKEGGVGGPLHNASRREVQYFPQSQVEEFLRSRSTGGVVVDDAINSDDDHELEEEQTREGRVPFDHSSLDRYRAFPPPSLTEPPSLTDNLRAVIQQYAERNTLRLCRRGKKIIGTDGSSYPAACGNRWSCPLCSPQLLAKSQHQIERLLQSVPVVVYLTFTVADEPGPPRAGSLDSILKTWSAAFSTGSWMSDFRVRSGLVGWVRTIEVTFPEGGFHPHIHAAFLFSEGKRGNSLEALLQRWLVSADRAGFRASYRAQKGYYVARGKDREKVSSYLCEQNAIRESRNGKGRTPGDLLHSVAATDDADDLGLLLGFHEAVAGRRKISTSRGFWDLCADPGQAR